LSVRSFNLQNCFVLPNFHMLVYQIQFDFTCQQRLWFLAKVYTHGTDLVDSFFKITRNKFMNYRMSDLPFFPFIYKFLLIEIAIQGDA
jgi:hypothetical protein